MLFSSLSNHQAFRDATGMMTNPGCFSGSRGTKILAPVRGAFWRLSIVSDADPCFGSLFSSCSASTVLNPVKIA